MDSDTIIKYLNHLASHKEIKEVEAWITSSSENREEFNLLKAEHIISTFEETAKIADTEKSYIQYKQNIQNNSLVELGVKSKWVAPLKYAAILMISFGLLYPFCTDSLNDNSPSSIVEIKEEVITLKLENGTLKVIEENGDTKVTDSKGNILVNQQGNKLQPTISQHSQNFWLKVKHRNTT